MLESLFDYSIVLCFLFELSFVVLFVFIKIIMNHFP